MDQPRFIAVDRFNSNDAWPFHVMDRLTAERDNFTDFREIAEGVAADRNDAVRKGEWDA
jgi:hypothetical protein